MRPLPEVKDIVEFRDWVGAQRRSP
jgi:hypothetical protein